MSPSSVVSISLFVGLIVEAIFVVILYEFATKFRTVTSSRLAAVICEDDGYPSLARFQLLLWVMTLIFAFVSVSLVRIFSGNYQNSISPPFSILELIGVNAGTTVVSYGISRPKYFTPPSDTSSAPVLPQWSLIANASGGTLQQTQQQLQQSVLVDSRALSTMLEENGVFSVTRFQMFVWTFLSIGIFLVMYLASVGSLSNLSNLNLPDIGSTVVALTGISQGTYLTGKGVST
jgi:hypothetical protein